MGLDLIGGLIPARASAEEARRAALHVADRVVAEQHEPSAARTELLTLLDALGLLPDGSTP